MKIIVGLGNPGKEYEKTRHNAGFRVMDAVADALHVEIMQKKFKALIASTRVGSESVLLMKPQTYMNLSGEALAEAMRFYQVKPQDIIVIYDDLDLPIGKIRLRQKGSAGGQKGMKSIIEHLHTQEFDRIRIGIGKDERVPVVDWVLGKIRKEDVEAHQESIEEAKEAVLYSITHSFMETMNRFNKK